MATREEKIEKAGRAYELTVETAPIRKKAMSLINGATNDFMLLATPGADGKYPYQLECKLYVGSRDGPKPTGASWVSNGKEPSLQISVINPVTGAPMKEFTDESNFYSVVGGLPPASVVGGANVSAMGNYRPASDPFWTTCKSDAVKSMYTSDPAPEFPAPQLKRSGKLAVCGDDSMEKFSAWLTHCNRRVGDYVVANMCWFPRLWGMFYKLMSEANGDPYMEYSMDFIRGMDKDAGYWDSTEAAAADPSHVDHEFAKQALKDRVLDLPFGRKSKPSLYCTPEYTPAGIRKFMIDSNRAAGPLRDCLTEMSYDSDRKRVRTRVPGAGTLSFSSTVGSSMASDEEAVSQKSRADTLFAECDDAFKAVYTTGVTSGSGRNRGPPRKLNPGETALRKFEHLPVLVLTDKPSTRAATEAERHLPAGSVVLVTCALTFKPVQFGVHADVRPYLTATSVVVVHRGRDFVAHSDPTPEEADAKVVGGLNLSAYRMQTMDLPGVQRDGAGVTSGGAIPGDKRDRDDSDQADDDPPAKRARTDSMDSDPVEDADMQ